MQTNEAALQKLWGMIKKHRFAMLTTQEDAEALRSRPMTTIDRDFDGSLWFFAKSDSDVVKSLETHPQVCLPTVNRPNSISSRWRALRWW